ncbi:MAG: hypothetical protein J3Q66DRAFT_358916 [Benniella sp.]|nr:MAG: hypothetical protein J3Q66DRAFT_358916 [Benniella sp.]
MSSCGGCCRASSCASLWAMLVSLTTSLLAASLISTSSVESSLIECPVSMLSGAPWGALDSTWEKRTVQALFRVSVPICLWL